MFTVLHNLKSVSQFVLIFALLFSSISITNGLIVELNDKNFDNTIKDDDRWVVQFYSKECRVCEKFKPNLEKLSELPEKEFGFLLKYAIIDIDDNPHLVSRFMASRVPQYYLIDQKKVHSFTAVQTYQYMYDFFKYKRWKLFPIREGSSDPFSNIAKLYGYFNVLGYFLEKNVFIYIPAKVFYGIVISSFFALIIFYAYHKHREFEKYISTFEKDIEEKYYNQCQKYGYDPFELIEEMDKKLKEKEEQKKKQKKLKKMDQQELEEFNSIKGRIEKKND